MRLDEYASYDATGLADLLQRKEVSPRDVAACTMAAVEALADPLNAVVEAFYDRADALQVLPPGPFGGVPTMLKDLFHGEAGTVCENGSRLCAGWVTPAESAFTARLRAAGLVTLGRTTTSEFGLMGTVETITAGRTCTPWSADHMAGGSSGGSAAAVGAGIVPVASASDGGGSIRIPASACGVVGLKPSRGRVSWGPQIGEALGGWAVHFMVTRSVRDTASLLDCLAGPSPGDPFLIAAPERPFADELGLPLVPPGLGPLRVAYCTRPWTGAEPDAEVASATEATASLLAELGCEVTEAAPNVPWEAFLTAMTDVWAADIAHTVDSLAALLGRQPSVDTLEGATLAAWEYGQTVPASRFLDATDVVNGLAREMGRFFGSYDVLLTATLGRLPAPLGRYDPAAAVSLQETFATWSELESFLPVFNATGQPAISLPLQMSAGGLPIGMQLVAGFGGESLLIRLAGQLEQAAPWSGRVPPLHAGASAG